MYSPHEERGSAVRPGQHELGGPSGEVILASYLTSAASIVGAFKAILVAVILLLRVVAPVAAGPLEDGVAAIERGDYAVAQRLFRPLADQGVAAAQYNLGLMYDSGRGVLQDPTEAARWYRLAADQGVAEAQYNLGVMYGKGQGVPQNDAEAVKWYRKAADQGLLSAQFNIGNMYVHGRGGPRNDAEAVKWYRKAADQGHDGAQFNLGLMYSSGRGVPQDYVNAHMWLNLSAAQGAQDAARERDEIARFMTPAQLAEAQKHAREWKPAAQSAR